MKIKFNTKIFRFYFTFEDAFHYHVKGFNLSQSDKKGVQKLNCMCLPYSVLLEIHNQVI